jgi:hypothetical protein
MASRRQRSSPTAGSDDLRAPLLNVCFSLLPSASLRRREDLATHLTIRNYSLKPALAESEESECKKFLAKVLVSRDDSLWCYECIDDIVYCIYVNSHTQENRKQKANQAYWLQGLE